MKFCKSCFERCVLSWSKEANCHGMFLKFEQIKKKRLDATVYKNTQQYCIWCVCVCVSVCACVAYSVFGVGRFEVIKQQDLCSGRFVSKVNLMKKSLFLSKKETQPT